MRVALVILLSGAAFMAAASPVRAQTSSAKTEEKWVPVDPARLAPLNPQKTVLLDKDQRRLVLQGEVCLTDGALEMLVCLKRTKEHEAIFSVDTKAQFVHAGLLALGIEPGHPVSFQPQYTPASGPQIDIHVSWKDADGKTVRQRGQDLVRHSVRRYWVEKLDPPPPDLDLENDGDLRFDPKRKELLWYGAMSDKQRDECLKLSADAGFQKAIRHIHASTKLRLLEGNWVFGGSGFQKDPESGERFYMAESGDLICVANFPTATIDLAIPSSASNDQLLYEAFTERLPPLKTSVWIELTPRPPVAKPPVAD